MSWSTASGEVPSTAVLGGIDKDKNKMYVARAYHEGDWIPGKVIPKRKRGYVSHDGREHEKHDFEVSFDSITQRFFAHEFSLCVPSTF